MILTVPEKILPRGMFPVEPLVTSFDKTAIATGGTHC